MKRAKPGNEGKETSFGVRSHDADLSPEAYALLPKRPIHLVLDRLRSAFNVGGVFRAADTARLAEVVTCGYTAHPPHVKLDKTALGADRYVPSRHFATTEEALRALKHEGVTLYALETTTASRPYTEVEYPQPVALVLGNEALGVSPEALALCDAIVEIPMAGYKNSMNVATACAVVVFEVLRQWGLCEAKAGVRDEASAP